MTNEQHLKYLQSLKPPFKCVYNDIDYVAIKKDSEWELMPCYKGEPIKAPLDAILTHIMLVTFD